VSLGCQVTLRASVDPVANELVLRDGGSSTLRDLDQTPTLEDSDGSLHGRFGQPGELA
jgi:hypothetical protein